MKRINKLWKSILFVLPLLMLVSCGDDNKENLLGYWQAETLTNSRGIESTVSGTVLVHFQENTARFFSSTESNEWSKDIDYTLDDNRLVIENEDRDSDNYDITQLDDETLKLVSVDDGDRTKESIIFKRIEEDKANELVETARAHTP